jgi:hypothetical protein
METRTSIIEIHNAALSLRADEAVAVVQQLINSIPEAGDTIGEEPFGPPSLHNVYLAEDGAVTCHACQVTPAVAETAIFLQQMLPEGTSRVPGALRYTIARALHEVDAPPFDSIRDFSAALERFESGDRTAVVRALVARATAVSLDRLRGSREDRRRLVPSSSDFRRELRAADARYYELATASVRIAASYPPPPPEPRRVVTVAAGIVAGLCLVFVGEVMHTRSTPPHVTPASPAGHQTLAVPDPEPAMVLKQEEEDIVSEPVSLRSAASVAPVTTASLSAERSSKSTVKRAARRPSQPAMHTHRDKGGQGVLDRLHLGWLRSTFTLRHDPL